MTEIPYDEMRAILGLRVPPFDKGGFLPGPPNPELLRLAIGEAIAFHIDGRIRVSVVEDVIEDGDGVTYKLSNPHWIQPGAFTELMKWVGATQAASRTGAVK